MKRLLLLVVAVAVSTTVGSAPASARMSSAGDPGRLVFSMVCGSVSSKLTYLFWPRGRIGYPSVYPPPPVGVGVPFDPTLPHVSVYRVGSAYMDSNWLGSVQVLDVPVDGFNASMTQRRMRSATTKPCGFGHSGPFNTRISHLESTEKATALTCRSEWGWLGFGGAVGKPPSTWKVRAADRNKVVLFEAKTTGIPKLRYDTSRCTRVALPR